jgi:hypothetical protein
MSNDQRIPTSLIWNEKRTFLVWFSIKVRTCFLIIPLTQVQEKAGLHTHTHLKFVVGLNRSMRITWGYDKCTLKTKPWRKQKFLIYVVHVVIVVMLLKFFAFCLRTSKDSSMWEFDKSIIRWFLSVYFSRILCVLISF